MTLNQAQYVQASLEQARLSGTSASLEAHHLPEDNATAYTIGLAQVDAVAAWKIGGANPWSRAVFNNDKIFFGALHHREVFVETPDLSIAGLNAPLAEPEIMLEIADWRSDDPLQRFSRMGIGFEIPASVLPDALKPQLNGQIVDRAGAGALWIAGACPLDLTCLAQDFPAQVWQNETPLDQGNSGNIIGGILGAANEFIDLANHYSAPIAQGQWIATGGLCPSVSVKPGDKLRVKALAWDLQVSLL